MYKFISVQNLGPLKKVSVDLSADFSVVVGPQASGKSTLGKIIYFCRKIRDYASDFIGEDEAFSGTSSEELYISFIKKLRKVFMGYFDSSEYSSEGFQVLYNYDANDFVHITLSKDGYVDFRFSEDIEKHLKDIFKVVVEVTEKQLKKSEKNIWNNRTFQKFWQHQTTIEIKLGWLSNAFHNDAEIIYIPAGRGMLSILANQITTATALTFDPSIRDFIERVQLAKLRFRKSLDKVIEDYVQTEKELFSEDDVHLSQALIKSILKADYVNDTDGEKLYVDSDHWVRLVYGSSGQQEALWILLFMFSLIMEHKRAFIILEEPEANVYPEAQKNIMELIALTLNSTQSQIFITTHSPYIMTSANVLIHSGRVENNISETEEIVVPKLFRINPDSTMAYKFSGNGAERELKNIRDNETGMFNASEIDTISEMIGEETDRLIDLEIKHDL